MSTLDFFSQGSPYLNHPLLTPERTAQEIDFILAQLDLAPGVRVLDVGCGPGRHSIELARRGYDVVGIDPAPAMIAAARARAAELGVSPDFRRISGESFVSQRQFDAAICLFTTLGQISEERENSGLVQRARDALRPGGHFVLETPQKEWAVRHLEPAERFGQGERYTDVSRRFEPADNCVTEVFKVVSPESTKNYRLRYRLFSRSELIDLLGQAGLSVLSCFGDYAGNLLGPDSATMLLIARR